MDTPAEIFPQDSRPCPQCQKPISFNANKCPYCQTDLRAWYVRHPILATLLVIILLGVIGSVINAANEPALSQSVGTTSTTTQLTPTTPTATTQAAPASRQPSSGVAATWHVEYTYSNDTDIQTPPFTLHAGEWKVTYTCDATPGYFGGEIDSAADGSLTAEIANGPSCPVSQTSYAYGQSAGQYYLNLSSDGPSYSVTVSDFY